MRMGQNWTMGDTCIQIDRNVKITALNNGDLGDLNNVNAAVASETNFFVLSDVFFTITRYQFNDCVLRAVAPAGPVGPTWP